MLRKIQQQFAADIVKRKANGAYLAGAGFIADELIRIYSNNYYLRLLEALEITYPQVKKLVGDEFFNHIGKKFIMKRPYAQGDLNLFGAEFADFIASSLECEKLPYLSDLARLEWALEKAYNAEDVKRQDIEILAGLDPAQYPNIKFSLSPSCFMVESFYPLFDLWQFDGSKELDLDAGGQTVLVWKQDYAVLVEPIEQDLKLFINNVENGKTLAESLEDSPAINSKVILNDLLNKSIIQSAYLIN